MALVPSRVLAGAHDAPVTCAAYARWRGPVAGQVDHAGRGHALAQTRTGTGGIVSALAFAESFRHLVSAGNDGALVCWSEKGRVLRRVQHATPLYAAAHDPARSRLVVGGAASSTSTSYARCAGAAPSRTTARRTPRAPQGSGAEARDPASASPSSPTRTPTSSGASRSTAARAGSSPRATIAPSAPSTPRRSTRARGTSRSRRRFAPSPTRTTPPSPRSTRPGEQLDPHRRVRRQSPRAHLARQPTQQRPSPPSAHRVGGVCPATRDLWVAGT